MKCDPARDGFLTSLGNGFSINQVVDTMDHVPLNL